MEERLLRHVLGVGAGAQGARQGREVAEQRRVLRVNPSWSIISPAMTASTPL